MKNIKLSILVTMSLVGFIHAGGDISPITPYETTDLEEANIEAIEVVEQPAPIQEEVVAEPVQEEVITPPAVKEPIVVKQPPIPVAPKEPVSTIGGAYVGLGAAVARYNTNCVCDNDAQDVTGGGVMKVGYDINKYIGVEARGVSTMINDDGAKVTHYGAYVKPMLPVGDKTRMYGLLGVGKSKTTGKLRRSDVDGFAWGAGVDYKLTDKVSAFVDYTKLIQKSDSKAPKLDSVSVGANYNF
jgi:hypothetical protein